MNTIVAMIYSLNEIDAQCKKAARGVGLQWGFAEEIGKAVRWLAAYELPGVSVFADYLKHKDNQPEQLQGPLPGTAANAINPPDGAMLCPLLTGAFLCDAHGSDENIQLYKLGYPLLLLPYLVQIANTNQTAVSFNYEDNQFRFCSGHLGSVSTQTVTCAQASQASCQQQDATIEGSTAKVTGQQINQTDWQILTRFAARIYVPATEASRQGAGPSE